MSAGAMPSVVSVERLDARVTALEGRSLEILDIVKAMQTDLKGSGKPQWAVIIAGLGFMLAILGFVGTSWKAPIETTVTRQDNDIRALQTNLVPRAEHADKWRGIDLMMEAMRERNTRDFSAQSQRIERLEERLLFNGGRQQPREGGKG